MEIEFVRDEDDNKKQPEKQTGGSSNDEDEDFLLADEEDEEAELEFDDGGGMSLKDVSAKDEEYMLQTVPDTEPPESIFLPNKFLHMYNHKWVQLQETEDMLNQCGVQDLMFLDADALIESLLDKRFLDVSHGGQFLHFTYLLERFVQGLQQRSVQFQVLFFDTPTTTVSSFCLPNSSNDGSNGSSSSGSSSGSIGSGSSSGNISTSIGISTSDPILVGELAMSSKNKVHNETYKLYKRLVEQQLTHLGITCVHFSHWFQNPVYEEYLKRHSPSLLVGSEKFQLQMMDCTLLKAVRYAYDLRFKANTIQGMTTSTFCLFPLSEQVTTGIKQLIQHQLDSAQKLQQKEEEEEEEGEEGEVEKEEKEAEQGEQQQQQLEEVTKETNNNEEEIDAEHEEFKRRLFAQLEALKKSDPALNELFFSREGGKLAAFLVAACHLVAQADEEDTETHLQLAQLVLATVLLQFQLPLELRAQRIEANYNYKTLPHFLEHFFYFYLNNYVFNYSDSKQWAGFEGLQPKMHDFFDGRLFTKISLWFYGHHVLKQAKDSVSVFLPLDSLMMTTPITQQAFQACRTLLQSCATQVSPNATVKLDWCIQELGLSSSRQLAQQQQQQQHINANQNLHALVPLQNDLVYTLAIDSQDPQEQPLLPMMGDQQVDQLYQKFSDELDSIKYSSSSEKDNNAQERLSFEPKNWREKKKLKDTTLLLNKYGNSLGSVNSQKVIQLDVARVDDNKSMTSIKSQLSSFANSIKQRIKDTQDRFTYFKEKEPKFFDEEVIGDRLYRLEEFVSALRETLRDVHATVDKLVNVFTVKFSHLHAKVTKEKLEQEMLVFGAVNFVQHDPAKKVATIYFDSLEIATIVVKRFNNKDFLGAKVQAVMKDMVDTENLDELREQHIQCYALLINILLGQLQLHKRRALNPILSDEKYWTIFEHICIIYDLVEGVNDLISQFCKNTSASKDDKKDKSKSKDDKKDKSKSKNDKKIKAKDDKKSTSSTTNSAKEDGYRKKIGANEVYKQLIGALLDCGFVHFAKKILSDHPDLGTKLTSKLDKLQNRDHVRLQFEYNTIYKSADEFLPDLTGAKKKERNFMYSLGFKPDPWQEDLIAHVNKDKSVLCTAPTSSGKTFIAFYVVEKILRESNDGVVVFVFPLDALVNQGYAELYSKFKKTYQNQNQHMLGVYSSSVQLNVLNSQVLITLPTFFEQLLLSPHTTEWKKRIKYVVLDEVHCINLSAEGGVWEHILMMMSSPFVALSATVGNALEFRHWLQAKQFHKHLAHRTQHVDTVAIARSTGSLESPATSLLNKECDVVVQVLKQNGVQLLELSVPQSSGNQITATLGNMLVTNEDSSVMIHPDLEILKPQLEECLLDRGLYVKDTNKWCTKGTSNSVVLDRVAHVVYTVQSHKTVESELRLFLTELGYRRIIKLHTHNRTTSGEPVTDTRSILSIGQEFAIANLSALTDESRKELLTEMEHTERKVIDITAQQAEMYHCAHVLQVKTYNEEQQQQKQQQQQQQQQLSSCSALVVSTTAYKAFTDEQRTQLQQFGKVVQINISEFERLTGTSVCSMFANVCAPERTVELVQYNERIRPLEYTVFNPKDNEEIARLRAEYDEREEKRKQERAERRKQREENDEEEESDEEEEEKEDDSYIPRHGSLHEIHPCAVLNPNYVDPRVVRAIPSMSPRQVLQLIQVAEKAAGNPSNSLLKQFDPQNFSHDSKTKFKDLGILSRTDVLTYSAELKNHLALLAEDPNNQPHLLKMFEMLRKDVDVAYQSINTRFGTRLHEPDYFIKTFPDLIDSLLSNKLLPTLTFTFDNTHIAKMYKELCLFVHRNKKNLWGNDTARTRAQGEIRKAIGEMEKLEGKDKPKPHLLKGLEYGIAIHNNLENQTYLTEVERLFRMRHIPVLIATGTMSLGINMPTRSVVMAGFSPYLHVGNKFAQCAGRSGRRGFDVKGMVVIHGFSQVNMNRLMVEPYQNLMGSFGAPATFVMRLLHLHNMTSSSGKIQQQQQEQQEQQKPQQKQLRAWDEEEEDDDDDDGNEQQQQKKRKKQQAVIRSNQFVIDECERTLLQPPFLLGNNNMADAFARQLPYHVRFAIELLCRQGLVNRNGKLLDLAQMAIDISVPSAKMYRSLLREPQNLIMMHLLQSGAFHRFVDQDGEQQSQSTPSPLGEQQSQPIPSPLGEQQSQPIPSPLGEVVNPDEKINKFLILMCYLFSQSRRMSKNAVTARVLPPIPEPLRSAINKYEEQVLHIYKFYANQYARSEYAAQLSDRTLPISKISYEEHSSHYLEQQQQEQVQQPQVQQQQQQQQVQQQQVQQQQQQVQQQVQPQVQQQQQQECSLASPEHTIASSISQKSGSLLNYLERERIVVASCSSFAALSGNSDNYASVSELLTNVRHTIHLTQVPHMEMNVGRINSFMLDFMHHGLIDKLSQENQFFSEKNAMRAIQSIRREVNTLKWTMPKFLSFSVEDKFYKLIKLAADKIDERLGYKREERKKKWIASIKVERSDEDQYGKRKTRADNAPLKTDELKKFKETGERKRDDEGHEGRQSRNDD